MSVLDKFLDVMNLKPQENEDFEEEGFYDEDDFEDDIPVKKPTRKEKKRKKEEQQEESKFATVKEKNVKVTPKVTPMRTNLTPVSEMKVCVIKPSSIEDEREVTETLLSNRTVVLNVEGLDLDIAQRIIDFASGSCFAIGGNLQKISNYIFIITPPNVDISGDVLNVVDNLEPSPTINTDF